MKTVNQLIEELRGLAIREGGGILVLFEDDANWLETIETVEFRNVVCGNGVDEYYNDDIAAAGKTVKAVVIGN